MAVRGGTAGRYAAALFSIARERGTTDVWASELQKLAAAVSDPQAMSVLKSPNLTPQQKQRALETAGAPVSREVSALLALLLQHKRIDRLPGLAEAFADLARKEKGIELANVTTAIALSDADRQSIGRWLAGYVGHPVEVRYGVDPEIIGGVVARVGDQLIDASVRGRLESLRKVLRGA